MGTAQESAGDLSAVRYARHLLGTLGGAAERPLSVEDVPPALGWARSGLMALTGNAEGDAQLCPAPLTVAADGVLAALASLAPAGAFDGLNGSQLLAERAAIAGHQRQGAVSPGGSCRLLATTDGAIALNLARDDDWALLPAWLERELVREWPAVAEALAGMSMHDAVERGRLLGLAVAPVVPPMRRPPAWCQSFGGPARRDGGNRVSRPPRVVDLSSLWAGPLCTHLLQRCGAEVVKVESVQRPDGARRGPSAFFDLLNAGKRSVALDFREAGDRARLRGLLAAADIVIESSRPRALQQLGIDAAALCAAHPRLTWVSLTGYGRADPQAQWIAYGDDAGVAAGLSWLMRQTAGQAMFVGDAIADPFAGLHAALAAWSGYRSGGAGLLSVALVDVLRQVIAFDAPVGVENWRQRAQAWRRQVRAEDIRAPSARQAAGAAPALGADTASVFADWAVTGRSSAC